MAAKKQIFFFLEDAAQEAIMPPLFARMVRDAGIGVDRFEFRVLSARGGDSIRAFEQFLIEIVGSSHLAPSALVVGSDGNCKGHLVRRQQLQAIADAHPSTSNVITAVPDPHVERWYMLDPAALAKVVGCSVVAAAPAYKCAKDHYKQLLRDAFRGSGVTPLLGGAEYGPEFADALNLYAAGKADAGLGDYIAQVKAWIKSEFAH
ncbi:MAG: hypothetical protein H7343_09775 [Undibacterium sp.]|nr:hypothetical protein [Opitutaceae bacterium]